MAVHVCACVVACLCPHNFISNVVASVTIHEMQQKKHETFVRMHVHTHLHLHFNTRTHTHTHVRVRVRVRSVIVCCCRCGLWWKRERRKETNRKQSQLIPSAVLRIAETERLYQAQGMIGGIGDMLFSIHSQT